MARLHGVMAATSILQSELRPVLLIRRYVAELAGQDNYGEGRREQE